MTLILPNDIINGTDADAVQVDENYDTIVGYVNANLINRDGLVGMQAPLLLAGPPSQPLHAATKAYVDAVLPIGVMFPYGGVASPGGGQWALCNGAALAQADYADLFNVIGNRFGTAAAGSFLLPNTAGRMMIGVDATDTATEPKADVVGKIGGTTVPPLKTHIHANDHNHGNVATGNNTSNHVHVATHDHGSFNASLPHHAHAVESAVRGSANPGTANSFIPASSDGTSRVVTNNPAVTGGGGVPIPINVPQWVGNTGPNATPHAHYLDMPAYVGVTGAPKEAVEAKYRPPFVVVSFIIRIK